MFRFRELGYGTTAQRRTLPNDYFDNSWRTLVFVLALGDTAAMSTACQSPEASLGERARDDTAAPLTRNWLPDSRPDAVRVIEPGAGYWGGWSRFSMCPPGTYALGFQARTESDQGKGDDTALNALVLWCRRPPGTSIYDTTPIKVDFIPDGIWGDWRSASCQYHGESDHGPWLIGGALKIEPPGHKDETGANAFEGICQSGETLHVNNEGRWGDWQPQARCGPHEAVCGFAARIMANLGDDADDTVLNGLKLMCCTLPSGACGNGYCEGEDCQSCPADCGACCGNGRCDYGETCSTCPSDCGSCCGNGTCDNGETCVSCVRDCGACPEPTSCPNPACKPPCSGSTLWCIETCTGLCVGGNVCVQGHWQQQSTMLSCNQAPPRVACGNAYAGLCRSVPTPPSLPPR